MEECIFCKIVKGDIPSHTVYEDEVVKAFLDIFPANEGHVLIIPKKHRKDIFDISEEELKQVVVVAKKLTSKLKKVLGVAEYNIIQSSGENAGQDVMHFHMHVLPRKKEDGMNIWSGKVPKKPDFETLAKKIRETKL